MSIFRQAFDWITVRDYVAAKNRAAIETAARYSRGNIAVQNGWFLDKTGLDLLSREGDKAISRLKQKASNK